jgi:hypothetical protein
MSYVVCVPSYNRPELCNEKTLAMLKTANIKKKSVYVFVANKQELKRYNEVLDKKLYHKIVLGKKGLVPQRQFAMEYFKQGEHIVFFDDDVVEVDLSLSKRFKTGTLDNFFKSAFSDCKKQKSFLWGPYPVYNPFFRKPRPEMTTDLRFIAGPFFGIINRPKLKSIKLTITRHNDQKEDVERTIRYFKNDGIVLRYDKIAVKTQYYASKSDYGTFEQRKKPMEQAAYNLLKAFPEYGTVVKKTTGMTEFKLNKNPKIKETPKNKINNKTKNKFKKSKKNKTFKK